MNLLKIKNLLIASMAVFFVLSCENNNNGADDVQIRKYDEFHVAFASGSGSASASYVQGIGDMSKGTISSLTGFQLESSRTARIFASDDGATLYSLNYTVGTIEKLAYYGGDQYKLIKRYDASVPLGVTAFRFTKLTDKEASVHYIKATAQYEEDGVTYKGHKMTLSLGIIDLENLTMKDGYQSNIDINLEDALTKEGYYISRIDAPVLSNGKLYYGAALNKVDPSNGNTTTVDKTITLVVNYSDLSDVSIISTNKVQGSTNGYRTSTQYTNESGEILQMVSNSKTSEVHIVKIKDGKYDESFDFNLTQKLGKASTSNGWFYAGNGIGYIPYQDLTKDKVTIGVDASGNPTTSAMWKLARMDFNKGTVVDLNVPDDLWLQQYQNSVVSKGVFYIALSPVGVDGNIYMFDVNSESPNGRLGAKITGTGADQYYIGIY